MPVKLNQERLAENAEARIEIIPLIDIMFFLLAAFMLVSLSMVNLKSIQVNLPTATTAEPQTRKDFVDISVDKAGTAYLDKSVTSYEELAAKLAGMRRANPALRVIISADRQALHGDVMRVLDLLRRVGIEKVAFEVGAKS